MKISKAWRMSLIAASLPSPCRRTVLRNGRALWPAVALTLLGGCATAPQLAPIGKGEPVAMFVVRGPQNEGLVKIHNLSQVDNARVGAGAGAVIGGLFGVSCGPWVTICMPAFASIGAAYGGLAGAAVGVTGALTEDQAARVRDRLTRAQQSHDLLDELRTSVTDRARKHWDLVSDPSATVVTVELQDVSLTSTRDERVGLTVRVVVSVRPSGSPPETAQKQKHYEHVGALSSLAVWLDEGSDLLDTSLSSATQKLATQIVSDLALN